jgi:hypothetical protein
MATLPLLVPPVAEYDTPLLSVTEPPLPSLELVWPPWMSTSAPWPESPAPIRTATAPLRPSTASPDLIRIWPDVALNTEPVAN